MGRIILCAGKILQNHLPRIFQLFWCQERTAQNVGVNRQSNGELAGDHGA